jgi:hypothetical protein
MSKPIDKLKKICYNISVWNLLPSRIAQKERQKAAKRAAKRNTQIRTHSAHYCKKQLCGGLIMKGI